jgi:hypothetical protein
LAIFDDGKLNFNVDVASGNIPHEHGPALDDLMEDVLAQVRAGQPSANHFHA